MKLEELESRLAPATFIWDGGGADNRWSTAANWDRDLAPNPIGGDDLVFPGTALQPANSNNFVNAVFNSITFSGSGYSITGNQISLGSPTPGSGFLIANAGATNNTIGFDILLTGAAGNRQFFTVGTLGANLTLAGQLRGTTGVELTKDGPGTLNLTNDNSAFIGPITVSTGILKINHAAGLGSTSAGTTVQTSGQLQLENVSGPILENLILNGLGPNNTGALLNVAGNNTWAGRIDLDSTASVGSNAGMTLNITGQIGDLGAGHSISKEGAGRVIFSRDNTYQGLTTVNNGTLTIRHPLALGAQGTVGNGTVVNSSLVGTATLQLEGVGGVGFTVLNEALTLNGPGVLGLGALYNLAGNNEWAGPVMLGSLPPNGSDVSIGVAANTHLTISGVVSDPNGIFDLTKVLPGRLILTNANTYRGQTNVQTGILNIRDSQGLGPALSSTTSVQSGAALEYEIDIRPDSVTGTTFSLHVEEVLSLSGRGFNNDGALRNLSGINEHSATIGLFGLNASIGVEPDLIPDPNENYFPFDAGLTVSDTISGGQATDFFKLGTGHLILPVANTYTGLTTIERGWVTILHNDALGGRIPGRGDTVQPGTTVLKDAALHLKAPLPGGQLIVPENLSLEGLGIAHPFARINRKGALMSLGGDNIASGDIALTGSVGIGVELLSPATFSELRTTGWIYDSVPPPLSFNINPSGGAAEDSQVLDTRSTSGTITINYDMNIIADSLRVYYPPRGQPGSTLLFDTGLVTGTGTVVVNYGPGLSTFVEIVVNEGGSATGTIIWSYSATVLPTSVGSGGIIKLGSQRLTIQGDGTYRGDVDIQEGVLRAQNDTALGRDTGNTTVHAGAALELRSGVPEFNGGISAGIQVGKGERLVLNGLGNTTAPTTNPGGLIRPLTVVDGQHLWRGRVTLGTHITVDVPTDSGLSIFGIIDDAPNPNLFGSELTKTGAGKLAFGADNTYRGATFINQGIITLLSGQALGLPGIGTVVAAGAALELQGDITVAGEMLTVQGSGVNLAPNLPLRWFAQGSAPIVGPGGQANTGRVSGIAVDPSDPDTIYLSAAGGGAWRTKNGGLTWEPLADSLSPLFAGAIESAPSDPRILYLGTGEATNSFLSYYGRGVYRSLDSGKSWALLTNPDGTNPLEGLAIARVAVDLSNPNLIYVAASDQAANGRTGNAGVWRYDPIGGWFNLTAARPGPNDDPRITFPSSNATYSDVVLSPNGNLYMALGTATGSRSNGVFRSPNPTSNSPNWFVGDGTANGGANPFPTGADPMSTRRNGRIRLTVHGGITLNTTTVYAAITNPVTGALLDLRKSTNGGQSWTAITSAPNYMGTDGDIYSVLAVDPTNANIVYAGGLAQILRSADGGATWVNIAAGAGGVGPHTGYHAMDFDSNNKLVVGTDGGIWRLDNSTPGSIQWTNLNGNLEITQFIGVAVHPSNRDVAYGGSHSNGTERYNNDPAWTQVAGGNGGFTRIDVRNPNIVYHQFQNDISTATSWLERSTDGGLTWTNITPPGSGLASFYTPYVIDNVNTSRLVVGANQVQETIDRGATWISLGGAFGTINAVALASYQGAFVDDPAFPLVFDKGANTYDPDTIYVVDGSIVRVTKDHGTTWVNRSSGLPNTAFADIIVDPRNRDTAYVVVDSFGGGKVFRTTDAGQSWTNITSNLPDLPTYKIVIDPRNGDLFVGNDEGVYQSTDDGSSWQRFGFGLPNVQARDLVLNETLNTLTVGTLGRSVFTLWLDSSRANAGALRSVSGSSVWTGPVLLGGDTVISADGTQDIQGTTSTAQLTIVGAISGNFALTKIGGGDVILAGSNTYGGVTTVQEGVLVVRNPNALGSAAAPTIVNAGTVLELQSNLNNEPLELFGDGFTFNGHNTGALRNVSNFNTYTNGTITLRSNSTIGVDSGSQLTLAASSVITDGTDQFSLTKELTGRLVFQGANSYDGATLVNQGALNVQNGLALGSAVSGTQVRDGAQLQLEGGITVTNEALELSGTGIFGSGALQNTSGSNTWRGPITLTSLPGFSPTTVPPPQVVVSVIGAAGSLTLDGPIDQSLGIFGFSKVGAGQLILTGNNTYGGLTLVFAGTLQIRSGQALGPAGLGTIVFTGAALELVNLAGMTVAGEVLVLNGSGVAPANAGALRNILGNNIWDGPVSLQSSSNVGVDALQTLTINAAIAGPAGAELRKVGAGTLVLTHANTYSGLTTVSAGVLQVTGSIGNVALTGGVGGGVLGGTGTVGTITSTASGGAVAPGNFATGILKSGTVTWNSTTLFVVELNSTTPGTGHDQLQVTGSVNLGNASLFGFTGPNVQIDDSFTIITATGGITGQFAQGNTVFIGGRKFTITYNPNSVVLTLSRADAIVTLTPSSNPAVFGQAVTYTATVTPLGGTGTVPNTDTVRFTVDGVSTTVQLNNGVATLTVPDYSVGVHAVSVAFDSDPLYNPVSVGPIFQVVNPASTFIFVSSSANASVFGQSVTISAGVGAVAPGAGIPTGSVIFFIDGIAQAPLALGQFGSASITLNNLSVGVHSIGVFYSGEARYQSHNTPTNFLQFVQQANADVAIVASPTPSRFGEAVTLTTTVTPRAPSTGTPSGLVGFYDGPTLLGFGSLNAAGVASFITPSLPTGFHYLAVSYAGDVNFAANFGVTAHIVERVTTATTLVSSANPSGFGQPATFTATVVGLNPTTAPLTGAVVFTIDGVVQPAVPLNASAQALLTTNLLGVGPHTITAVYTGNTNFDASTSTPLTQTVSQGATTTTVASSQNPTLFGQSVTFTFTVAPPSAGAPQPTGTVSFTIDGTPQPDVTLNAQGQATFTTASLEVGTHAVVASYSGNATYTGSTSPTFNQVVSAGSATTLATTSANALFGQAAITATVTPTGENLGTPTGQVVFRLTQGATTTTVPVSLVNGVATLTPPLNVGTYTIVAEYSGDGNYAGSTSSPLAQIVQKAGTTTTLATTSASAVYGEAAITATVTPVAPGAGTPTGFVVFGLTRSGVTTFAVASLVNGVATLTPPLAPGTYSITAGYAGDANFNPSTSAPISQTVATAATSTTLASSSPTAIYGEAVITATVAPLVSGFGVPTGFVVFGLTRAGVTTFAVASLVNGVATLTPPLDVGTYSITAGYSGDGNYGLSSSAALNQTVSAADSAILVTSSGSPSFIGQLVTFGARVTGASPSTATGTGVVTFFVGGVAAATDVPLVDGWAFYSTSSLAIGQHTITVAYAGNGNLNASTSADFAHAVLSNPLTFLSVPTTTVSGQTFTVQVEYRDASGVRLTSYNGPVTLAVNTGPFGGFLGGNVTALAVNGIATFSGLTLSRAGNYTLQATTPGIGQAVVTSAIAVTASSLSAFASPSPTVPVQVAPFQLGVTAFDVTGNVATNFNGPVTVALVGGVAGGTLTGTLTTTMFQGVATFTDLFVNLSGDYLLMIQAGDRVAFLWVAARGRRL